MTAEAAKPLPRKRIPMSVPTRRLEVPDISGFHTHWALEHNVARMLEAGYEIVKRGEVPINQRGVASNINVSGNTDLGDNISVIGGMGESGKPELHILMKIRNEWWEEDRKVIDGRNASIFEQIFRGQKILGVETDAPGDKGTRYIDPSRTTSPKALFQRPPKKE